MRRLTLVATLIVTFAAAGLLAQAAAAQVPGTPSWADPAVIVMASKSELESQQQIGSPAVDSGTWVTVYNGYVDACRTRVKFFDEGGNQQCSVTTMIQPYTMATFGSVEPNAFLRNTQLLCGDLTDHEGYAVVYTEKNQCGKFIVVDAERIYSDEDAVIQAIRDLRVVDVSGRSDKFQEGD